MEGPSPGPVLQTKKVIDSISNTPLACGGARPEGPVRISTQWDKCGGKAGRMKKWFLVLILVAAILEKGSLLFFTELRKFQALCVGIDVDGLCCPGLIIALQSVLSSGGLANSTG